MDEYTIDEHPDHGDLAAHEKLPHCKDETHVHVSVLGAHPTVKMTATRLAHCDCKNTPYTGPGVIIARGHDVTKGLHLLPDLIAVMPTDLREAATAARGEGAGHTVGITHTSVKVFIIFGALTPDDAVELAAGIEAAAS